MVTIEHLMATLQEKGIKPSYQRLKVLEYLSSQKGHPTADEIFLEVSKAIPTLSKTTVYNTLDIFSKAGLVRAITIENNEIRYDPIVSTHGHFKCEVCNEIYNFMIDGDNLTSEDLDKHCIKEKNVYFKGICSPCTTK